MSVLPDARRSAETSSHLGDVAFQPSAGAVLYYELRIYAEGTTTPILATKYLGKPNAYADGFIRVNCRTTFDALPAGNYDPIIAAVGAGGTDESPHGTAVTVPLQP